MASPHLKAVIFDVSSEQLRYSLHPRKKPELLLLAAVDWWSRLPEPAHRHCRVRAGQGSALQLYQLFHVSRTDCLRRLTTW